MEKNLINARYNLLHFIILMTLGCSNTPKSNYGAIERLSYCDTIRVEDVKKLVNHKKLSEVHSIWKCALEKDTLIESDDDVSWKAKAFYDNQTLLFTVESNWQDIDQVRQVNIYSNTVVNKNYVRVGSAFKDILAFIDIRNLPSLPDGYLAVLDKKDKSMLYFIDIEKYPKLQQGVGSISQIPEDAKVLYITIKID
jgi:hypothetical protein